MNRRLLTIGKQLLAVAIVVLLLWFVGTAELLQSLQRLSAEAVVNLLLVSVLLIYISALKWALFVEAVGAARVAVANLFGLYLMGYFVNLLLPSYLGGDAVRSYQLGRKVGQHQALAATILERYTGLVAMVSLGFVCMWFVPFATREIQIAVILVACALTVVTFLALSPHLLRALQRIPQLAVIVKHLEKIRLALDLAARDWRAMLQGFLLSFLYHSITVLNTLIAAHAVGWTSAPIGQLFVVLPLILLVGALPLTPQGVGVQEGAFVYFLHAIGASPAEALGISIVLRAKSYVLALVGGVVWVRVKRLNDGREPSS